MDSQRWNQTFRLKQFTFCIINEDLNLKAIHKAQRKRMGVTQEQLALIADVDRSYFGAVRNVTFTVLCRLCIALECDVSSITIDLPPITNR